MAEDWSIDVRKYAPDADSGVIAAIVRYLGIALQNRDSSLVSFSDKAETDRVRENYLKKKLGLTDSDAALDSAIAEVGERMGGDPTKNRVTAYYLLAEKFRKLSVFGGMDRRVGGAAAMAATAAAAPAAAVVADTPIERRIEREQPPAAPYAVRAGAAAAPARRGITWWPWLLAAALAALLVGLVLLANRRPAEVATAPTVASVETAPAATAQAPAPAEAAPPVATTPAPAAGTTIGLPANVYFALGSAAIGPGSQAAINAAASAANAGGARLAITGYTDRTGDLAQNQALARNRAVAVRDALIAAGVSEANIEMRPPAMVETGSTNAPELDARRVEISRL